MTTKPSHSYKDHANYQARYHPLFHYVLLPLSLVTLVFALIYMVMSAVKGEFSLSVFLLMALVIMSIITGLLARVYALKVQDRLIRLEEQFRYYMLTNKPIDPRLTIPQLISLRFAPDEEFPMLAEKAAENGMTPLMIKNEIQKWRADNHRV